MALLHNSKSRLSPRSEVLLLTMSRMVSVGESYGHMISHMDYESAGHADIFATAYALYSSPLTNQVYTITNSNTIRIF